MSTVESLRDEVVGLLQELIRLNTVNPPGNESGNCSSRRAGSARIDVAFACESRAIASSAAERRGKSGSGAGGATVAIALLSASRPELMSGPRAGNVMQALMQMTKLDIAALKGASEKIEDQK